MLNHVYFIRHGETAWSLSGQHTSRTELTLTEKGEADARKLAPRLASVQFSRVLTSPRQRARRTCELAGLGGAVEIEPDLAEWDYGDYEGLRSSEIFARRPAWNLFEDGCPNGEMPAEVSARADALLGRLRGMEGNVAIFSHGHFGRVLGVRWINLPVGAGPRFALSTASLSIFGFEHHHSAEPVIGLWNSESG
jgi:broad specificity phosphatase PhoE